MWNQITDLYDVYAGLAENRNLIILCAMALTAFVTTIKLFDEFFKQFKTLVRWFKKWSRFFSGMKKRDEGTTKMFYVKSSIKKWYDAI
ncbi:hypothetical protein bcgnr5390_12940 [Bacillus luti]|nr:hypothetical protein BC2903_51620 [Bacillus cereus]